MAWLYNSFRPLANTTAGRAAVRRFGLPPFIDGSCRREPDLQSAFPSISALCRKGKFAPRLSIGDTIVYVTVKGQWEGASVRHRRLVAVLRVRERFASHEEAASWYRASNLPLPSNCLVSGNAPIPFEQTVQDRPDLHRWDLAYHAIARSHPVFLVTDALFRDVEDPPVVTDEMLMDTFGRMPGTQNPPVIARDQGLRLLELAGAEFST
jgi:hypothetical protein